MKKKPKTILALFKGHRERWIQRNSARTSRQGSVVWANSPYATCWCLYGAHEYVYGDGPERRFTATWKRLCKAVVKAAGGDPHMAVVTWNDDRKRTFKEVLELVRKAKV